MTVLSRTLDRRKSFLITLIASGTLIAGWWSFARILPHSVAQVFLPTPIDVLSHLVLMLRTGLWLDVGVSCVRIIAGVSVGFLCALPIGLAIVLDRRFEAATEPLTSALRYTPLTAFIPLFMLKLGIGETHKITILSLGIFVQILPIVVESLRGVERNYLDIAHSYGFTDAKLVRRVLLPRIMPSLVDSIRVGFAIGWAYVVLVEFWGSEAGLGHRLWRGQRFNHPDEVYACAIMVGILGLTCDVGIRVLRRLLFRWERGRTMGSSA